MATMEVPLGGEMAGSAPISGILRALLEEAA